MPDTPGTLYYGDNLDVMRAYIPDGSVDLIYLDPPFSSNRDYFVLFRDRTGVASQAQQRAFMDTWNWDDGAERAFRELQLECPNRRLAFNMEAMRQLVGETPMMAYLVSMATRLLEMHRTLKDTGSMFLHCDQTASPFLRIVLTAIFGPRGFRSEITWKRQSAHNDAKQGRRGLGNITDTILYYTKGDKFTFNTLYTPYDEEYVRTFYKHVEEGTGRRYRLSDLTAAKPGGDTKYEWVGPGGVGVRPYGSRSWAYSRENMTRFEQEGRLVYSRTGMPQYKRYLDEMPGVVLQDRWDDIRPVAGSEALGYPTQKPLALLERIIRMSSNPGDVVMDTFCGCGTAVHAAQKLGRRWIGIDITSVAIDIIRDRMEKAYPALRGGITVHGMPKDLEGARRLFEKDPYEFQRWACTLIKGRALEKKGADNGIDGWRPFIDYDGRKQDAIVQVKGGKTQVSQVRDFCHVVTRERAALGFFLCMGDERSSVTAPMRSEARREGHWRDYAGQEHPRVQILTVKGLLDGTERPDMPALDKGSSLGYTARVQQASVRQTELFSD